MLQQRLALDCAARCLFAARLGVGLAARNFKKAVNCFGIARQFQIGLASVLTLPSHRISGAVLHISLVLARAARFASRSLGLLVAGVRRSTSRASIVLFVFG